MNQITEPKNQECEIVSETTKQQIIQTVQKESTTWKKAFNSQDALACANQYEDDAIMEVKSIGTFQGKKAIQAFWQKIIDDGFLDVEYHNPTIEVIDQTCAILSSKWKMNKAYGVIYKELWVIQPDGSAKLKEDVFEILG